MTVLAGPMVDKQLGWVLDVCLQNLNMQLFYHEKVAPPQKNLLESSFVLSSSKWKPFSLDDRIDEQKTLFFIQMSFCWGGGIYVNQPCAESAGVYAIRSGYQNCSSLDHIQSLKMSVRYKTAVRLQNHLAWDLPMKWGSLRAARRVREIVTNIYVWAPQSLDPHYET